ncbi:MAG TPA: AMP-binding protein [Mesorhizobium sp.]
MNNVSFSVLRRVDYDALYDGFQWCLPERFNIGVAVADRWAEREPGRTALLDFGAAIEGDAKEPRALSFGELSSRSNQLANGLTALGVKPGDRVALLLPQSFETVIAHCAVYKLGAIAVPLALLFGVEALEFRLNFAGACVLFTNARGLETIAPVRDKVAGLKHIVLVDGAVAERNVHHAAEEPGKPMAFETLLGGGSRDFTPVDSGPDDPALMIFTSGTTGPPKGALHGHRVLLGHMPGFEMAYEFPPRGDDILWTPADWAWAGGLLNALLPALSLGIPVAFGAFQRFDPQRAYRLMEAAKVTLAFLPPTAIRMMKAAGNLASAHELRLRAVLSAGEQLGRETYEWAEREFGFKVNEFYGQTECNLVLGSCAAIGISRAGAIGRQVPGHRVAVIDEAGAEVASGQVGQIAVRSPDPVMFLGYWNDEAATAKKFAGDWMITGDQGVVDADGYVHFFGRDDDVITSAGYRIGPGEIEDCLAGHPAVALAAAVGKPDPVRAEIVKAYVLLREGFAGSAALADDIKAFVRARLSAHEYPREVEFVDAVPLTTTGKVIRRIFRDRARAEAEQI